MGLQQLFRRLMAKDNLRLHENEPFESGLSRIFAGEDPKDLAFASRSAVHQLPNVFNETFHYPEQIRAYRRPGGQCEVFLVETAEPDARTDKPTEMRKFSLGLYPPAIAAGVEGIRPYSLRLPDEAAPGDVSGRAAIYKTNFDNFRAQQTPTPAPVLATAKP